MHDAIKHTVGTAVGTGFFGASVVTLDNANKWAALVCAILGSISFACTIHSWWKKQQHYKANPPKRK